MIWAILAAIGVPLWLCAAGILTLLLRNRRMRRRPGNVPVRLLRPGKRRWRGGHAVWVHDVFLFRGSPAAWSEAVLWVADASLREPTAGERGKLHRIGNDPVVATLTTADGGALTLAARAGDELKLLGPFADVPSTRRPVAT
jgi:hypothetical protein